MNLLGRVPGHNQHLRRIIRQGAATPSELVRPTKIEFTVMPVRATDCAKPRATATCAVLVIS